jgi:hypothetical protein
MYDHTREKGHIMIRILYLFFLAVFLTNCIHASWGGVYCDTTRPPGFPKDPPPYAEQLQGKAKQAPQNSQNAEQFTVTYDLARGWNIISFPFYRVGVRAEAAPLWRRELLYY